MGCWRIHSTLVRHLAIGLKTSLRRYGFLPCEFFCFAFVVVDVAVVVVVVVALLCFVLFCFVLFVFLVCFLGVVLLVGWFE